MALYGAGDRDREFAEGDGPSWRSDFARDYGRIIHSACFRRLQGKTQVFPGHESDFFRNRLTHSLEVAQIAEGIADRINDTVDGFKGDPIKARICMTAALAHDLGHPPFGHNGERALDHAMRLHGGFEGNAQTLRIVARNERKVVEGGRSHGLNLTFRTLAGILKYDKRIPHARRDGAKLCKGYYGSEAALVGRIKQSVAGDPERRDFKSVECAIMDLADDIAYSTFDLEDSLKVGFLTPASILSSSERLLERVARKVTKELEKVDAEEVDAEEVLATFQDLFADPKAGQPAESDRLAVFVEVFRASETLASSAQVRTAFSSDLVKKAIGAVRVEYDVERPMLSRVAFTREMRRRIEILKQYTFIATITSSRLKIPEYRGYQVVADIFRALASDQGRHLLPEDVRDLYEDLEDDLDAQMRCVCDFVAGMTDRYAMEFYGRLHSDTAQSMFKPI